MTNALELKNMIEIKFEIVWGESKAKKYLQRQ